MDKTNTSLELVSQMKRALMDRVQDWLGIHISSEGTEDYEIWLT